MSWAIITGASSGIGKEFARRIKETGRVDRYLLIARRKEKLEDLARELGEGAEVLSADLAKPEGIEAVRAYLAEQKPSVRYLINAAGYGVFGDYTQVSEADTVGMIDLNVTALTAMTKLTLPYMNRGAEIYQIGSFSAFEPLPYMSVYAATTAYVLSFSRSLTRELKARGIHAMAVCPSWVRTEFLDRAATYRDVVTYFDRFYTPKQVVARAIKDMKRRRDVSVCGAKHRFLRLMAKLLPHRLVMKIWCFQQKK